MFLPQDYEAPKSPSGYLSLGQGTTTIRILSEPLLMWLDFKDKVPYRERFKGLDSKPAPLGDKPVKHVWGVVCWNYNEQAIQIWEIGQKSIRDPIEKLAKNPKWGAPYAYDIEIFRKGEGINSEYTVTPCAKEPLREAIKAAFLDKPVNLEALLEGKDPFASGYASYAEGVFDASDIKTAAKGRLLAKLEQCKPSFQQQVKETLVKQNLPLSMEGLPTALEDRIEKGINKNIAEWKAELEAEADAIFGGV